RAPVGHRALRAVLPVAGARGVLVGVRGVRARRKPAVADVAAPSRAARARVAARWYGGRHVDRARRCPVSTLKKVVLRDQVREFILERIITGAYAPGQRLVETQIARELECSQAPVREALRDLEQLGCVHYEPNRGCSVRAFSVEELLEAYPVRAVLEGLAAEQAASRITEAELSELDALFAEMCDGAERGD